MTLKHFVMVQYDYIIGPFETLHEAQQFVASTKISGYDYGDCSWALHILGMSPSDANKVKDLNIEDQNMHVIEYKVHTIQF